MSRSGYNDGGWESKEECWSYIRYRGAVKSAINGKRGQAFLVELLKALDALPSKELISQELEHDGAFCALGAVGKARGINMANVDVEDRDAVSNLFNIPVSFACEIMFENDEGAWYVDSDSNRFDRMRNWALNNLKVKGKHGTS